MALDGRQTLGGLAPLDGRQTLDGLTALDGRQALGGLTALDGRMTLLSRCCVDLGVRLDVEGTLLTQSLP